jgi:hypothetical protein
MIVLFGGYGTFGVHAARRLAEAGLPLRIAGRDAARADVVADVNDPSSLQSALSGARVAVNCTGPFSTMTLALPKACLAAGVHYVDIADHRGWIDQLRTLDHEFRERSLTAAVGCSSLPGISGALAILAARRLPSVERARITLFIGNRNPKGEAAVRAAMTQLGRPFPAPQGTLRGFHGRETVTLPPPFGPRGVYDWDSPELDLFPNLLGAREVRVKVGFEARLATLSFAGLARLGPRLGGLLLTAMTPVARHLSTFGHSGGFVKVELFAPDGSTAAATLGRESEGQRMAALPAAFVAQGILDGSVTTRGVTTAYEALGADRLVERLVAEGYDFRED